MPNPTGLWVFIGSLLYVANGIAGVVFKTGDDPIEIQDNSGSVNDCQFISISIDRLIHDACVSVTAPHSFIGDLRFMVFVCRRLSVWRCRERVFCNAAYGC